MWCTSRVNLEERQEEIWTKIKLDKLFVRVYLVPENNHRSSVSSCRRCRLSSTVQPGLPCLLLHSSPTDNVTLGERVLSDCLRRSHEGNARTRTAGFVDGRQRANGEGRGGRGLGTRRLKFPVPTAIRSTIMTSDLLFSLPIVTFQC